MAKFRKKAEIVDAVQITRSTWSEVCELADVGKFEDVENNWIVRELDGSLGFYAPSRFQQEFELAEDPNRRESVEFEPNWGKYPKLVALLREKFEDTGLAFVCASEIRELLADARADAVQYVRDVRADELMKARLDERKRIQAMANKDDTTS